MTLIVPDAVLSTTTPIISVGNAFKKDSAADFMTFDFSNTTIDDGTYTLVSFASTEGFDLEDTSTDFIVKGLGDKSWSLDWTTNALKLTVSEVPEPASVAFIFAFVALAIAQYRRRK